MVPVEKCEELVEYLAIECSVPKRFAKLVLSTDDVTDIELLKQRIHFLKVAVRVAGLNEYFPNEIEIQSLALVYNVAVAKIILLAERYNSMLSRQERFSFLMKVLDKLMRDVYILLP